MINVNVFSEEKAWSKRLKNKNLFFKKVCKAFPKKYCFSNKKVSLSLLLSNNKNIKRLNNKFRGKNKPTDILSFPLKTQINSKFYLGDIIISYQFMNKPRTSDDLIFKKKVIKIFIHGFLHLIGYDHKTDNDYKKMYDQEVKIFNLIEDKIEKIN